jgi:hypothetical protein
MSGDGFCGGEGIVAVVQKSSPDVGGGLKENDWANNRDRVPAHL